VDAGAADAEAAGTAGVRIVEVASGGGDVRAGEAAGGETAGGELAGSTDADGGAVEGEST
jgi:hypothetical protein